MLFGQNVQECGVGAVCESKLLDIWNRRRKQVTLLVTLSHSGRLITSVSQVVGSDNAMASARVLSRSEDSIKH